MLDCLALAEAGDLLEDREEVFDQERLLGVLRRSVPAADTGHELPEACVLGWALETGLFMLSTDCRDRAGKACVRERRRPVGHVEGGSIC